MVEPCGIAPHPLPSSGDAVHLYGLHKMACLAGYAPALLDLEFSLITKSQTCKMVLPAGYAPATPRLSSGCSSE